MKFSYFFSRAAISASAMLFSFSAGAQNDVDRLIVDLKAPTRTVTGTFNATIEAFDPGRGSKNGEGIGRIEIQLLDAQTRRALLAKGFNTPGSAGGFQFLLPPPYTATFDTREITSPGRLRRDVILVATVSGFTQGPSNNRFTPRTVIERRLTVNNGGSGNASNNGIALNVPSRNARLGGDFTFKVTGRNITRVDFNVKSTSLVDSFNVSKSDSNAPFEFPVDLTAATSSFGVVEAKITRRNGRVQTIRRSFTFDNPEVPKKADPVVATPTPTPPASVPTTVDGDQTKRLNVTLSTQENATVSGNFDATVVAFDPARGSNNGEGIGRIDINIIDPSTGRALLGKSFNTPGSAGGFQFLLDPPFTATFDSQRITNGNNPVKEVIVRAIVSGFTQGPSDARFTPRTVIDRKITIDNSAAFGNELSINVPKRRAQIGGNFEFKISGPSIERVDYRVRATASSDPLDVSGSVTTAPFNFTVDLRNSRSYGLLTADVTRTNGEVERITRFFLIVNSGAKSLAANNVSSNTIVSSISKNAISVASDEAIKTVDVYDLSGAKVASKSMSGTDAEVTVDLPNPTQGVYILKVNGEKTVKFIK